MKYFIDILKTKKLEIISILLYIIAFSLINQSFWYVYDFFKYAIIVVIGIYLLFNYRLFFKKEFRLINILLVCFSVLTVFFSYLHMNSLTFRNPFLASIVFVAIILEIFGVFEVVSIEHKTAEILVLYYKITAFWCIFLDLCIFLCPELIIRDSVYIVGTKFQVSYINILFIAFFLSRNNIDNKSPRKYLISLILLVFGVAVSIKVDCMTGVIGTAAIIVLYLLFSKKYGVLRNPLTLGASFILCGIFPFICDIILSNPYVEKIVTELLKRSGNLTNREWIYEELPELLKGHLLTGYGVGSEFEVFHNYIGFPNSQNGIISWITEFGIVAALILCAVFLVIFYYAMDKKSSTLLPLILFVYVFVLMGTVEISFQYMFYGVFAIILCFVKDSQFWEGE